MLYAYILCSIIVAIAIFTVTYKVKCFAYEYRYSELAKDTFTAIMAGAVWPLTCTMFLCGLFWGEINVIRRPHARSRD